MTGHINYEEYTTVLLGRIVNECLCGRVWRYKPKLPVVVRSLDDQQVRVKCPTCGFSTTWFSVAKGVQPLITQWQMCNRYQQTHINNWSKYHEQRESRSYSSR